MRYLFSIIVLFALSATLSAACLFKDGKTEYVIVVSDVASESEKTAAYELQMYLRQISGAEFDIQSIDKQFKSPTLIKHIYVGYNPTVSKLLHVPSPTKEDEGFTYKSIGDDIFIWGGSQRGTMYGVFSFLENELGVRWYTADFTKVPQREAFFFDHYNHTEEPYIMYRDTWYFVSRENTEWSAHNKNNFHWFARCDKYGGEEACLGVHTMSEYVPAATYYKTHPEYFALRNGKRVVDAQCCLSNPAVLKITVKHVLERIRENPNYLMYDVSQNDNLFFCECANCKNIEARYGNKHSGLILWFVNKVADAVYRYYPEKKICTLAYQYSREAPDNIKPQKNVVVRLCDIECCFAHPLEDCSENTSFLHDMKGWSSITDNLFVWDYVVNFHHYIAPYPNFSVLAKNIRTFKKHGVKTLFEEGQYESYGGEFADLKAWVLSKLLWNAHLDTDKLVDEFITDYYGIAADYIKQYYALCQSLIKKDTHLHYDKWVGDNIITKSFVKKSRKLLDNAMNVCDDVVVRERVEDVRAQVLYLQIKMNPIKSRANGDKAEFDKYVKKRGTFVRERQTPEDYLQSNKYI